MYTELSTATVHALRAQTGLRAGEMEFAPASITEAQARNVHLKRRTRSRKLELNVIRGQRRMADVADRQAQAFDRMRAWCKQRDQRQQGERERPAQGLAPPEGLRLGTHPSTGNGHLDHTRWTQ